MYAKTWNMSTLTYPPDIQRFVSEELASGKYPSEQALIVEAVRLLRDDQVRSQQFRGELRAEIGRIERGEGTVLEGDEALATFFDELRAEARAELAAEQGSRS
jgi:Arc/MetJ-type ribon-helix-helix transcriptional regulator